MKASAKEMTTDIRDAVRNALIGCHERVRLAGLLAGMNQEDFACAMLAGLGETIGIILSESCKNDRERLVEFYPRLEDIIQATVKKAWKGHLPGCTCSDG